jgi:UDP-N-acetylglucosamine:LPS N-acetylglucosamine transferase
MTPVSPQSRFTKEGSAINEPRALKVCLASSPGGHLAELQTLAGGLEGVDQLLVTVESPHTRSVFRNVRKRFVVRVERNPAKLVLNVLQALSVLIDESPDVVISTGAGDVVPLMLLAAGLGIPVVFAESVARVNKPSVTGRLVRRWVDLTIVPWPSLRQAYPRAVCVAPMVSPGKSVRSLPPSPSIIILTGTGPRGFDRLVREVDHLVREGKLTGRVYAQIGASTYTPEHYGYDRFLPHDRLLEAIQASDLVVTHCGAGSIRESLDAGKVTIVVPRNPRAGEVLYQGGADLAKYLASLGWVTLVENPADIPKAIANQQYTAPSAPPVSEPHASHVLTGFLRSLQVEFRKTDE